MKAIIYSLLAVALVVFLGIYFIPIAMFFLKVIIFLGILLVFALGFMTGQFFAKRKE